MSRTANRSRSPRRHSGISLDYKETLRNFAVRSFDDPFTHTSLKGSSDPLSTTGRFYVGQEQLPEFYEAIAKAFEAEEPLHLVEQNTDIYPMFEDLDVEAPTQAAAPDHLLHPSFPHGEAFWKHRAALMHEMFPDLQPLTLHLYSASGFDTAKQVQKSSFHAIWPQIYLDQKRAHTVRLRTVNGFETCTEEWCETLKSELAEADPSNTWDAVFDIATVRVRSCRLPLCDKVEKGPTKNSEGRPVLPVGVLEFDFENGEVYTVWKHYSTELSYADWVMAGTVRAGPTQMLTPWTSPAADKVITSRPIYEQVVFSKSGGKASRKVKVGEKKIRSDPESQYRRRWSNATNASDFKVELDWAVLGEDNPSMSTIEETPTCGRERMYIYQCKSLKGSVKLLLPSGLMTLEGNATQAAFMLELVKDFTTEWTGPVPQAYPVPEGAAWGRKAAEGAYGLN